MSCGPQKILKNRVDAVSAKNRIVHIFLYWAQLPPVKSQFSKSRVNETRAMNKKPRLDLMARLPIVQKDKIMSK